MNSDELKIIIEKHEKWLLGHEDGERADLPCTDLRGADLHGAYLRRANLYGADLRCANLCEADLSEADLREADLRVASLYGADLHEADLCGADLSDADLRRSDLQDANLCVANLRVANLCWADLREANLRKSDLHEAHLYGANLHGADLREANMHGAILCEAVNVPFVPVLCPDSGSFTAWKKANGHIVKLLIPEDARRSSATGRKCRCDKAFVVAIETMDGESVELDEIASDYDGTFIYKVGGTVKEPDFCEDRFKECAPGIHFFINRQEAVDYD